MSDSYQAIYDAVRSRISGGDVGAAVRDIAGQAFDISWMKQRIEQEMNCAIAEHVRPSVLFRPNLRRQPSAPQDQAWTAIYGPPESASVVGFGATPDAAMRDFDARWIAKEAA